MQLLFDLKGKINMKIGIDVGGSHIGVGLIDDKYNLIEKQEYNWKEEEKGSIDKICNSMQIYSIKIIDELLEKNGFKKEDIQYIGIGFPNKNIIDNKLILEGNMLNVTEKISEYYNKKVYFRNDVKCSGMYVKKIAELKEYNNCLFLTLGTGIGGAYFYKNELVVPNKYSGLEIGHMIIQKDGLKCRCGNSGCFEMYASMKAFRAKIEELFNVEHVNSKIVLDIVERKEKEQEVNKIIDEYLNYLSLGLSNLINIFEPDAICIGGSFAHYESIFIDKLKTKVKDYFKNREIPEILVTKSANDAGIIGATIL